jgi:hypothetical protein
MIVYRTEGTELAQTEWKCGQLKRYDLYCTSNADPDE